MPPQDGVFEGSTDFGALDKGSNPGTAPKKGRRDSVWDGDLDTPPEGVPANWWKDAVRLYSTEGHLQKYVQALRGKAKNDPNYRFDGGGTAQEIYQYLVDSIKADWNSQTDGVKKMWTDAEAAGNPFPPYTTEGKTWAEENQRQGEADQVRDDFEDWEARFLPKLEEAAAGAAAGDQAAIETLRSLMGSIQDPEIRDYVGDYVSQAASAAPSQESIDRQKAAYDKTWGLTDVRETAEEKLLREMARRKQEQDLRAQRGAFANDLQARGVYGSGAELTMNLMAQQEAANRRSMEEMMANSNASERAMRALEQAGTMSDAIRKSEAQESQFRGTAADKAAEFNRTLRDGYDNWMTKQKAEINRDRIDRGTVVAKAEADAADKQFGRQTTITGQTLAGTTGKTGTTLQGNIPVWNIGDRDIDVAEKRHDEKLIY